MKTLLRYTIIAIIFSLLIIFEFLLASSFLLTEKPGFVTACVSSLLISGVIAFKYPATRWYLSVIIYIPLLLLLIIAYNGEGMKFYLTSVSICILVTYIGSILGALLNSKRKHGLGLKLKIGVAVSIILILIILTGYLADRNARLDRPLIAVLDTIFNADQDLVRQNKGWDINSPEWIEWAEKCDETDSVNLIKVAEIIDRYDWPGEDIIGRLGSSALWVVIQHSTLKDQEKYEPLMKEAVRKGRARSSQLALLEDRILKNSGEPQIYGTHVTADSLGNRMFWPIKDEQNVNKRRFSMGLEPIGWYAKKMGVKYKSRNSEKQ